MITRAPRAPWTCLRCLRLAQKQQQLQKRYGSSVPAQAVAATAATAYQNDTPIPNLASLSTSNKDHTLRQIFDSQPFWRQFAANGLSRSDGRRAGLFGNKFLKSANGFRLFAETNLRRCQALVDKIHASSSVADYKHLPRRLDRLSDLLCRVIDSSDFVRSTHPEEAMQAAATEAYARMFEYMNVLNTDPRLHQQLRAAMAIPEVVTSWSEEEVVVAKQLMADFEKSAINLPEEARSRYVELSSAIADAGTNFVETMEPSRSHIELDAKQLQGADPRYLKQYSSWGKVRLPTIGSSSYSALRHVTDPDARREIYLARRTASQTSIARMEALIGLRAELAQLSGYETFARYALSDKMAQTPEAVNQFLQALTRSNQPKVQAELSELLKMKKSHMQQSETTVDAWDRDYYTSQLQSQRRPVTRSGDLLHTYFSLGTVMQGLSRLFQRLYGVRFEPRETLPGETWNDDVRRLDVIDETQGHIATIYCDLFERAGKSPNPAHFTVRCSRRIDSDEVTEVLQEHHNDNTTNALGFDSPIDAVNDGMSISQDQSTGALYQLPVIALICDFARPDHPSISSQPTLLSFREVQTLFHEMGHALHSCLGRTAMQNVAGTRCATDFAELPSVLMERFCYAPSVLSLFARHWSTDKPLPYASIQDRLQLDREMQAAENESQILLAMLDQAYHSSLPLSPSFNSTSVYHDVWNSASSIPEPQQTAWQGFFGHLFGYGATYYAYLFDRAIAGKVWSEVFAGGEKAVDRRAGERYRDAVLRWGGARSGWMCIADVLSRPELAQGGEKAMEEVGRWGVEE